jgi:hypothetical protein
LLSAIGVFVENSCTEADKLLELEQFLGHYKKYIYYFTMVDLILYLTTIALDLFFGSKILMSKNKCMLPNSTPMAGE